MEEFTLPVCKELLSPEIQLNNFSFNAHWNWLGVKCVEFQVYCDFEPAV